MKVLHISYTPIAGAPGNISKIINQYTKWESRVYVEKKSTGVINFEFDYKDSLASNELKEFSKQCDIIHFHNSIPEEWIQKIFLKPYVIQLHSEPRVKQYIVDRYPKQCFTLAQKHGTLYKGLPIVPNVIPIEDSHYLPKKKQAGKIIIVYTPSNKVSLKDYANTCQGKGYQETIKILDLIKKKFGKAVEIKVCYGARKEVALEIKQDADIVIDECVTGGYHLTSLEGLSCGALVFAYLSSEVQEIIRYVTNATQLPWLNYNIENLYKGLEDYILLAQSDLEQFRILQAQSRQWMIKYWHPKKMIRYYLGIYKSVLDI